MEILEHYIEDLFTFLNDSPTSFHATATAGRLLAEKDFIQLDEAEPWGELSAGKYFVTRNSSSLIAFTLSAGATGCKSLRMAGAHSDSPCLKLKPEPLVQQLGYWQLGVEVYGGALLAPWFDRDCSLAGRIIWQHPNGQLQETLLHCKRPLVVIPSLAIHLDPDVHKQRSINRQIELMPIFSLIEQTDFRKFLLDELQKEHPQTPQEARILTFDLFLYDTQPPAVLGLKNEFICSSRLDNLLSCHALVRALADCTEGKDSLIVLNDHEEVGSVSTSGAQGSFLKDVLGRVFPFEKECRVLAQSLFISADNAHALHPNFIGKYEPQYAPMINGGPVIKVNANQRYASNAVTEACFRMLCKEAKVPCQSFVMRNDMACGTTIGPLTAAALGVSTVDVGVPQLAMHSVRETAGSHDGWYLLKVLKTYFCAETVW